MLKISECRASELILIETDGKYRFLVGSSFLCLLFGMIVLNALLSLFRWILSEFLMFSCFEWNHQSLCFIYFAFLWVLLLFAVLINNIKKPFWVNELFILFYFILFYFVNELFKTLAMLIWAFFLLINYSLGGRKSGSKCLGNDSYRMHMW